MSEANVKFYNMLIHLVRNDKLYKENVAIKNVWQKEGNTFLDIYFYRKRKSYIFDSVFIHDILDLSNEKYYKNIDNFITDFQDQNIVDKKNNSIANIADKKIFEKISPDLIILSFMAKCCGNYTQIKEKIIFDYILKSIPRAQILSNQYLTAYIATLNPNEEDFYNAINSINYQNVKSIKKMCFDVLKICLADGRMHYREKKYLAELLQNMREAGIKIDLGL